MFGPNFHPLIHIVEYDMVTGIIQNLRNSPRVLCGLLLTVCLVGILLVSFLTDELDSTPFRVLPAEYWLYSGIRLIFLFGFLISLASLLNLKRRLSDTMTALGFLNLIFSVFRLGKAEWTGNDIHVVVIACLSFAIAVVLKVREHKVERAERSRNLL